MAENIKIVAWETKDGNQKFFSKGISSEDLGVAKWFIANFEEKLQEGMPVQLHEWVEYFQCKAIVFGASCYKEDVKRHRSNPLFPLIMEGIDTKESESN